MNSAPAIYTVAITGGIAAGKSAVTERFERLGIAVLDADQAARDVVAPATPGLQAVIAAFGPSMLASAGTLDRAAMRALVFAEPSARQRLEGILHPLIHQRLRDQLRAASGPYAMVSIPLLAEHAETYRWIDRVLLVDANPAIQLTRLMQRDRIDRTLAQRMLDSQSSRQARLALADDVIDNNGDEAALDHAVAELHHGYQQWADSRRLA